MSDNVGRRPDGPGWYWYRGRVRDAIDFYERTYDIQDDVDQPVWVQNDYDVYIPGWQKADGWKYLSDYATPSDMPGDFTPLHPPVAAPEPDWSQAPEWAMWTAITPMGTRRMWFEMKPTQAEWTDTESAGWFVASGEQSFTYFDNEVDGDWRTTLRRRPEASDD